MKKYTIREKLIILFTIIFTIISTVVLLNTIFNNTTLFNVTKPILIFLFSFVYVLLIGVLYWILKKNKKILEKEVLIISIIMIVLFVFQLVYSCNSYTEYGWDCGNVLKSAESLLENHQFDANYYIQYYNNVYIMLFFKTLYYICRLIGINNYLFASIVANIIAIDVSIILIYLVSKKIFGKYGGYASLIFSIPVLGMTPWMIIPYTDTLSMVFPILAFYLYLLIKEQPNWKKKIALLMLLGSCLVLGLIIKPTAIIIAIALILVELLFFEINKKNIKNAAKSIICIIVGAVLIYGVAEAYKEYEIGEFLSKEKSEEVEFPMTHFMMMGLKTYETADGKFAYGVFDQEDVVNTGSHPGKKNKIKYNLEEIKARLQNMGVTGYASFVYHKLNWILCDGSFFYGGEGAFHTSDPFAKGKIAEAVQSFSYTTSENYYIYQSFLQAMWILVQAGIVVSIFVEKWDKINKETTIIRLTIWGICMFVVLFEGRSRYVVNHLPFFILLATYGFIRLDYKQK